MKTVSIVVLSKFPDVFEGFYSSANTNFPRIPKILIRDQEMITPPNDPQWKTIQGPEVFSIPVNATLGFKAAPEDDILYCGDDVRFTHPDSMESLQREAYSDPLIGILSPRIIGAVGNFLQSDPCETGITYSSQRLAFPCVYIKREAIDMIGYPDPLFGISYGYDDDDYCYRMQLAGYRLAITPYVRVEHKHASGTYSRSNIDYTSCATGAEKFVSKWGPDIFEKLSKLNAVPTRTMPKAPAVAAIPSAPSRFKRSLR